MRILTVLAATLSALAAEPSHAAYAAYSAHATPIAQAAYTASIPDSAPITDSAGGKSIDLHANRVHTWILPSWGSAESETYWLSALQAGVDALGIFGIIKEFQSHEPDYRKVIVATAALATMLGNRLISVSLNRGFARDYNARLLSPPEAGPDPKAFHGGLMVGTGRSSGMPGLGVFTEYRGAGLRLTLAGYYEDSTASRQSAAGPVEVTNSRESEAIGLEGYYRIMLGRLFELNPGMLASFSSFAFTEQEPDAGNPGAVTTVETSQPTTFSLVPFADLVYHPVKRFQVSLGLNARAYGPGHAEKPHRNESGITAPDSPGRFGVNFDLVWRIW
ncbi:MAG: hypothetical protein ABI036_12425 [Fibrobacteria bacterium]